MSATDEELLVELADRLRHRFYGKYRGIVTDNNDPSGMMRIKATVPAVLGGTETGWAMPCVPYAGDSVGMFFLPDKDAGVWIEFEGGDVSLPIWAGCYWRSQEVPSDASTTTRGFVTAATSKLLFNDDSSDASVTVTDANNNTLTLDSNGIEQSRGSSKVTVSDSSVSINDGAIEAI